MLQKSDKFQQHGVAGVVILYNPEQDVIENINSYLDQIDYLFIIDNSEKPNPSIQEFSKTNKKIQYIINKQNLGVATALNLGANKAFESGFKYLLTMDQDSRAPFNLVECLLNIAKTDETIGIASPVHSNKYGTHIKHNNTNNNVSYVISVMTSGNLLSLNVFKKTGEFCDDFFIDYVDIEYCIRLNYKNYKVVQLNNLILEHKEANISEKNFFLRKFYPTNNAPFRWYYKTRNLLYLRDKYKKIFPGPLKIEYNTYLRNILKIIIFEKQKITKIKMIIYGYIDYRNNKLGKSQKDF